MKGNELYNQYIDNTKYSQNGQDAFVITHFNNKKNGVFIDIGAHDGISISNTYYLEKELNWTGICFEPIPSIYDYLKNNRTCICVNAAVSDIEGVEIFNYVTDINFLSGLKKDYEELHLERVLRETNKPDGSIEEIEVECVLLNNMLKEHNIYHVDFLSIDTEGGELNILKSIDYDVFDIKLICVENNYRTDDIYDFLVTKGYDCAGYLGCDEVFIKK
jgi:FkbM family methyltransferase